MNYRSLFFGLLLFAFFSFLPVLALADATPAAMTASALQPDTAAPLDATLQVVAGGKQVQVGGAAVAALSFAFTALGVFARWLVGFIFGTKGKIPLPEQTRLLLDHAIQAGLSIAESKLREKVAQLKPLEVKNEIVATAANFVLGAAPQLVTMLGFTPEKLRALIEKKFDVREEAAAQATT